MEKGDEFVAKFKVSNEAYLGFLNVFKDRNPLHTNGDFARLKGFKGEVMHGNILNGFISFFVGECLPMKNVIIHSQSIQFALPVYVEDELTLNAKVVDYFESVEAYQFEFAFINAEGKKVARGKVQIGVI